MHYASICWLLADNGKVPLDLPKVNTLSIVLLTFAFILLFEIIVYIFLYRKSRIDEALVRTGIGGVKVSVGHGILVIPFLHKIKSVNLNEHTLCFEFKNDQGLVWFNREIFNGKILTTVQVPPENITMIIAAARSFKNTDNPEEIYNTVEPAFRAAIREHFRTYRVETFDAEPSTIEVRLNRSLDIVAFTFGLKMRAVYIQEEISTENQQNSDKHSDA